LASDAGTQKINAYMAANNLPDIIRIFGNSAVMGPYVSGGYLAELNPDDYSADNFLPGSFSAFTYDGKLYGLPKNSDCMVLYYNKALFDQFGVKVPETFDELIAAGATFNANGIAPIAIDGADTWLESLLFHQIVLSEGGNQATIYDTLTGKTTFATDPALMKAADMVKLMVDNNMFQQGYVTTDYGTARNYFGQGLAAMYYMGSWESGLATDEAFSEEFRSNLGCMTFPVGTSGNPGDLIAWNGGGYGVAANSANKEEAMKFLAFMFQPDQLTKISWQVAGAIPAQQWDAYKTGNETAVQNQLVTIMSGATSLSGTDFQDTQTPEFKNNVCDAVSALFAGVMTPAEALAALDQAVANLK
jgi:raffinose/stachyose/melibiose transport system substrate-binding protein